MRMSSFLLSTALLAVLAATAALDEDFGFDLSDDFEVEIDGGARRLWSNKEVTANVGKAFHLVVPKKAFGRDLQGYEAKRLGGKPLPSWLLFDKTGGVFWGVPLSEDVETLNLYVKAIGGDKNTSEELVIHVVESPADARATEKCPTTEDSTLLTLLIDKGVRAIKPKQRVIAINNIAKFFGLPFSAFTLKSQIGKDDITDSSVVLAGPGNLRTRSSKLTSFLQVPVGCEGRLWLKTAPLVHQLKQQARDGTIAEVIGLPLIGWRVKTETKPILRSKRQVDDYGSGDYEDDYYDENYDEEEYDDEDGNGPGTGARGTTTSSTTTTTTATVSQTHPHRHHHGEVKNSDEDQFSVPVARDKHHQSTSPRFALETDEVTLAMVPEHSPTTVPTTTSTAKTAATTTAKPTTEQETITTPTRPNSSTAAKFLPPTETTTPKSKTNPSEYDYEFEDYGLEEDDDEDAPESKTIVPEFTPTKHVVPETTQPELPTTTTTTTIRTTTKEVVPETIAPVTSTTTEEATLPVIIEDTESPTVVITEPHEQATEASSTTTTPTTTTTTAPTTVPSTTTPSKTSTTPVAIVPTMTETTVNEEEISTLKVTTVRHVMSTPRTTTVREVTDAVEYEAKNFAPYIENRIQQMSVIAGKIFRYVVPKNTFNDLEDGYNLTLEFLNSKREPITKDSWCHFNPARREIYGLPLEEDVSKWEYVLRATDREGSSVEDRFTIQVQQHKSQRVVNHEFSLYVRIEKHQEFKHFVDWCLKILRALGRIYNSNMSEITVRHVNYTSEPVVFTWTNDSLPTNHCPAEEIEKLFNILTANDQGDPSRELNLALAPELRAKEVRRRGLGVCEETGEKTPQVPVTPPTNFPPFLRNPVDHINATVGELLMFSVPDDTFYDPEDTDSRKLNISLLTADRQPIKPSNWLQFDSKNREFYGIPRKVGRSEYQLVCVDSAGLPATDSLEIVVYPAPKVHYNVEFSMTLETPYDSFINNAAMQKKFVEKLQTLFGDRNASYIHVSPFKQKHDATIVTWYNKTLTTAKCPHDEINRLESVMKNHDRSISSRVHSIMDPEFPVSTIKVLPVGNCKTKPLTPVPPPEDRIPVEEPGSDPSAEQYQYLMTFIIPAVIIAVMLFVTAVAACVLYRKRRTGKMNVEEDGRTSYGNKGIPVIFQEELEEKPEPGTKTPVILKDEKPPLAPPEYSKSGSLKLTDDSEPYQPPPPFTRAQDNSRQPRPKPTPTYRKPPPYVPP